MVASNESTSLPTSPGGASNGASGAQAVERVVRGAHETIDRIAEAAVPRVQHWQDSLQHGSEHAREVGEEWAESVRATVREHPVASILTALAVGVLIARLTSSSSSR